MKNVIKSHLIILCKTCSNVIRITFNYVLENKAKIAKESIETQLQHEFLDEDQLIVESSEIKKGQKSKAL